LNSEINFYYLNYMHYNIEKKEMSIRAARAIHPKKQRAFCWKLTVRNRYKNAAMLENYGSAAFEKLGDYARNG